MTTETATYSRDGDATMRERMLAGDPYQADDPELSAMAQRAQVLAERFNATSVAEPDRGRELLVEMLGGLGERSVIRAPLHVDYGVHLSLGRDCFVNYGLVALDCGLITLGDHVQVGPGVQLLTATHPVEPGPRRDLWEGAQPITIGDNVWLGGGVVVCPGVTIGEDTVVGAGAVVVRDLPAGVVAVGNPARVLKRVDGTPYVAPPDAAEA
ncbi:sugar O-acetyltransferase [Nocardioides lentus]|uniref:Sugar O-acetyltransferase n=1 Tax=Nocardioides lentus TaxID=338077 RepID=A0ABP5ARH4_9ACTN